MVGLHQQHSIAVSRQQRDKKTLTMHMKKYCNTAVCTIYQCFSTFSLKWNPFQQFWLLTEPMGAASNLSRGKIVKFEADGRRRERG